MEQVMEKFRYLKNSYLRAANNANRRPSSVIARPEACILIKKKEMEDGTLITSDRRY